MKKHVCAVLALSLLAAGCTTTAQQGPRPTVEEIVDRSNKTFSALIGGAIDQCIDFAASNKAPDKAKFAKYGYKPTFGLGFPAYFRPKEEGGSRFPGSRGVTFVFHSWIDRCMVTSNGVGGGVYMLAGWIRSELVKRGWKKVKSDSKYRYRYVKNGVEVEVSGSQSGGLAQVVLHQTDKMKN
ncbi:hypothetical protein [Pseudovibrio sp. Ad26]|uniref:hypothetical protein n=1 Tax=Pseudovibrio sp. Ad26 TaxID=989410 RepID=UPI0007AE6410|nr:hypothetical protein [Pseudovibrio sp. Ad26]KZL13248.1 hypothetical protein PsAD26_02018 [Pseudovibrio sp. Ad26]